MSIQMATVLGSGVADSQEDRDEAGDPLGDVGAEGNRQPLAESAAPRTVDEADDYLVWRLNPMAEIHHIYDCWHGLTG